MRAALVVLLLVLAQGLAAAAPAPDRVSLRSSQPASFEGDLRVEVAGGTLAALDREARFEGGGVATGRLVVVEWDYYRATTSFNQPVEDPRVTTYDLRASALRLVVAGETGSLAVVTGEGGTLTLEGAVEAAGRPARVPADTPHEARVDLPGPRWPDSLDVSWREGWLAFGTMDAARAPMTAFPLPESPRVRLDGEHRVGLFGGNLTFADAQGQVRTLRLGQWDATEGPLTAQPLVQKVTARQAIVEGALDGAVFTLPARWGAAGPQATWLVDGTFRWTDADGHAHADGEAATFDGATVEADVAGAFDVLPPALGALEAASYDGEGDVRVLRVDGATLAAPVTSTPYAAPAALGAGAVLLLLLTKVGQSLLAAGAASLYTRLSPGEVLAHPQRKRLHDVVLASPGIHQRELHRRLGGAWGPFAFHLRMLAKAGHVRVVRQGAYALVFPSGAPITPAAAIPHPVARAVYDALPPDGAPVLLMDVVARVGVSRELVGYHLRGLEARGLVTRLQLHGRRGVARAPREAAAPDVSGPGDDPTLKGPLSG